jgi:hypothetical protein
MKMMGRKDKKMQHNGRNRMDEQNTVLGSKNISIGVVNITADRKYEHFGKSKEAPRTSNGIIDIHYLESYMKRETRNNHHDVLGRRRSERSCRAGGIFR